MRANRYYGVILAGGRGTRFWPRSRKLNPKQLLPFAGQRSLLRETVERLRPLIPAERVWVLTNEALVKAVRAELPELPPAQVLAEPVQRNTAPCLGLAARILESIDPGAVMGVFPADHMITRPAAYRRVLARAFRAASEGGLVTVGIQPRWPETGYGYLEFPKGVTPDSNLAVPVIRFREKPDRPAAVRFLRAGHYYWNSGMFFWRSSVLLDALRLHLPQTASLLDSLPAWGSRAFPARLREVFPLCDNISVDYAVMEKAKGVLGVPAGDIGWSDLGSWNAVYEILAGSDGATVARSDVLELDSGGNYVDAPGKLVALVGIRDAVVVETPDALLVVGREQAQRVGEVVKLLEQRKRDDLL